MIENVLVKLWDIIVSLLGVIENVWSWLSQNIKIEIAWLKIPFLLPDGISIDLGWSLLDFFGVGIIAILILWIIKALIPAG